MQDTQHSSNIVLNTLFTTCIITSLYTAHQRWAETFGGFDEQIFLIKAAGFKKDEDYMVLLWNLFLLSLLLCILASGVIETNLSEHSVDKRGKILHEPIVIIRWILSSFPVSQSEGSRHSLLSMVVRFGLKLACIGHKYNQHHCFAPLYDVHIENAFRTQFELIFHTGIGRCSKRITIHLNVSDFKEGAWVIGDN